METSAKKATNVEEAFMELAHKIVNQILIEENKLEPRHIVKIKHPNDKFLSKLSNPFKKKNCIFL